MRTTSRILVLLTLPLLLVGCATRITNLTPSQQVRNPTGMYPVEAAWESAQQSIRKDTIKANVLIGLDTYPMQPTPLVKNRWETVVPVPADKNSLNYRFKFDYEYLGIPSRKKGSKLSPQHQLKILDK